MKRLVLVGLLVVVLALAMAVPALAKSGDAQGEPVMNITLKTTNGWSWSPNGIWSLRDLVEQAQVWQTGPESFYFVGTWEGKWSTIVGVPSPGGGGSAGHDASGTVQGRLTATFSAPGLNPPDGWAVRGFIGTFDNGGTLDDLGHPGPLFPPGQFSSVATYFPGFSSFTILGHSETCRYHGQTWIYSLVNGNSGDIVIP
jgi:hypothetical protein